MKQRATVMRIRTGMSKRWKQALVAMCALAVLPQIGKGTPTVGKIVHSHRFVLREANGSARTILESDEQGFPCLVMMDKKGNNRITLNVYADQNVELVLYDGNGSTRCEATIAEDGTPSVSLLAGEELRADCTIQDDGNPQVTLCDEQGTPRLMAGLGDAETGLFFISKDEMKMVKLVITPDGVLHDFFQKKH